MVAHGRIGTAPGAGVIVSPPRTRAAWAAMYDATALAPDAVRWMPSLTTQLDWLAEYVAQSAICSRPPYCNAFCSRMRLLSRNV